MIISYFAESQKAGDSYNELQRLVNDRELTEEETGPIDLQHRITVDFPALKKINPDVVGWIRLECTDIDYPVVRTDNNDYYLNHLFSGEKNNNGSIFVDYRNTGDFSDKNTVIYGHHMKNGMMFSPLEKYKNQAFYDANPTITLLTPNGDYYIELICGTVEDGNTQFIDFYFNNENDFVEYIESLRARSTFVSDVELMPEDRIVSLCTCSYEWSNARFMVIGRVVSAQ